MKWRSDTYVRFAALAMHRLSLYYSGGADAAAAAAAAASTEAASSAAAAASATPAPDAGAAAAAAAASLAAAAAPPAEGAAAAAPAAVAPPAAASAPEKYDLKVPDGSTVDAEFVNRTADTARALGLSNEAGQKLLDAQIAEVSKASTVAVEAAKAEQLKAMQPGGAVWTEQEAKWRGTALTDSEIGGSPEKLQVNVDLANKVVNRFATDDAKKFFQDSGLGSHPELVRVFARIGKTMSEATFALPNARASVAATADDRLRNRYPTMAAQS
jgi:hypothetical protein